MRRNLRILLVEDSEDDAAALQPVLEQAGYDTTIERVDTAAGMSAALERQSWDLVLSDHYMPRFSSQAALRLLRDRGVDLPFIAIVGGSIGEEVVAALMRDGAQDYLSKNDLSRVGPAIERALREMEGVRARRRAEEALRASEERFALAVRGSNDGLWDWSLTTGEFYYSSRLKELLGFEEHEFNGIEAFGARIHEADRKRVWTALQDHLAGQSRFDVELRLATKQNELRWF